MFNIIIFQSCVESNNDSINLEQGKSDVDQIVANNTYRKDNIVIQHIKAQPDGLHPFNSNSSIRTFIFQYTQKTLIKLDLETLKYIPYLVEDMAEIDTTGLKYTYKIKEGIRWDDGTPLTAKDVDFTVKTMLCPLTNNTQIRNNYTSVIKSIELYPEDPLKFTMIAHGVHYTNKDIFSEIYIQQKNYWDPDGILDNINYNNLFNDKGKANTEFDKKYVTDEISNYFTKYNSDDNSYTPSRLQGLGAYQVTEWETGQYITIEKKEKWWGEGDSSIYNTAYPRKIIFKIIKDKISIELALKNQTIDVSNRVETKSLIDLQKREDFNSNYESDFLDQYTYYYLGMNTKPDGIKHKKLFVDKNVRRAIAYTVPIDLIIDVILEGKAIRQAAQISPLKDTYNDTLKIIPLDIEKAKKILTNAGWIDTDGDNIRDKIVDGEKLQFRFKLSYMSSPTSKVIALMIKEKMYLAGILADPTPMDFTLFYKNAQEHNFDAMLGGWGGSASYSNPMQLWHTSSWVTKGSNFCGFGDAESDALIDEANHTLDEEKHREALWKLQARIYDEQPYVFTYVPKNKIAIHKRFDNRNMYFERPGVILNNLKLNNNTLSTTTVE